MNQDLFIQLIKEHQNILHKISNVYANSFEDKEDLFQEMTFQLWKSRKSFKGQAKISTWIYRVALNTALSSFRKNRIKLEYTDQHLKWDDQTNDDSFSQNQALLFEAMRILPEGERALMVLFLDGYAHKEIGHIMGMTENNVNVKMSRIRNKIREKLKK